MKVYKQPKIKGMKVCWKGKTDFLNFEHGQICDVISIEMGWYRVVNGTGEDYLYPPECFEIVERQPITTDFIPLAGKELLILTDDSDLYRGRLQAIEFTIDTNKAKSITLENVKYHGKSVDGTMRLNVSDIANVEEVIWKPKREKMAI